MLEKKELIAKLAQNGLPAFRAKQIFHAVYKEGKGEYTLIKNIPAAARALLEREIPIFSIEPVIVKESADKATKKALFRTRDDKKIESVLMGFRDGRQSVCVSSQVGCQLGCRFCATGTMKFGRNLSYEEIADQVLFYAHALQRKNKHVTNIIFMGMGEPFMNYENVIRAIRLLNDPDTLHIGARNITVSTSGICEGIEKLADENLQVNLAVSLHAPNQTIREKIMPIARKYKLIELMEAINHYLEKTNRRVSYEYVMLRGMNDSKENAWELAALVKDQLCHINLIPYNATGIEGIEGSSKESIRNFRDVLTKEGIACTIRVTMGQEIDAACGQLANKSSNTNL